MVLHIPNFLIKSLVFGWMGYLTYTYVEYSGRTSLGSTDWKTSRAS